MSTSIQITNPLSKQAECMFCLEALSENHKNKMRMEGCNCKPFFHDTCIIHWKKDYPESCPVCRKQVKIYDSVEKAKEEEKEEYRNNLACCACMYILGLIITPFILD